jgi:DNA-binding CsgD family transcriptional regulator
MSLDSDLIDRMYEAAVLPELWPAVCAELCAAIDVHSVAVMTMSPETDVGFVCNPEMAEPFHRFSQSDARFANVRPGRALEHHPGAFIRDLDIMTAEEIANDRIYREFIRPYGIGAIAGCVIAEPSGHSIVFDIMRLERQGLFTDSDLARLNALKPDLARAALLTARLSFRQAQSITSALALIGLPAAVIGDEGGVIAANAAFEAIGHGIRIGAGNRMRLAGGGAQALFVDGLERMRAGLSAAVQSIPIGAFEDSPALVLHLVPIRRQARDAFGRSLAVAIVTPVGRNGPPDKGLLAGLFDLTPGEARVAREIAAGVAYDMIAVRLNLSVETIRTHVKRIMAKTGTMRQAELAALLTGVGTISFRA